MSSFRFGDYFAYRTTKAILTVMKRGVRVLKYGGRGGVGRPPACAGARPPARATQSLAEGRLGSGRRPEPRLLCMAEPSPLVRKHVWVT